MRDDTAADYVLGLLDDAETAAVEQRLAAPVTAEYDALARDVGRLRDMLLELDFTAEPLDLAPDAWDRLSARLTASPAMETAPRDARRAAPGARAPGAPSQRRTRGGWRPLAIAASFVAVLLASAVVWQAVSPIEPAVVAVLLDAGGQPVAVLEVSAENEVVVTPLARAEAGPSEVLQLWTKPDPDGPPVSVGLLDAVARLVVRNAGLPAPTAGQLFEITVEPPGGSPTGLPTGPIFGIGNAQAPVLGDS